MFAISVVIYPGKVFGLFPLDQILTYPSRGTVCTCVTECVSVCVATSSQACAQRKEAPCVESGVAASPREESQAGFWFGGL